MVRGCFTRGRAGRSTGRARVIGFSPKKLAQRKPSFAARAFADQALLLQVENAPHQSCGHCRAHHNASQDAGDIAKNRSNDGTRQQAEPDRNLTGCGKAQQLWIGRIGWLVGSKSRPATNGAIARRSNSRQIHEIPDARRSTEHSCIARPGNRSCWGWPNKAMSCTAPVEHPSRQPTQEEESG